MLDPEVQAQVDQLVQELVAQVRAEARKFWNRAPHALDRQEMEGIGNDALVWAAVHWEGYCERNGYSPAATQYFRAYALRRIRGALLDYQRDQDWVPRAVRTRYKAIQEAEEAREPLPAGMDATEARETVAAVALRPVSLDERTEDVPGLSGVETQAVTSGLLEALQEARWRLPLPGQAVVALRFYRGMTIPEIAAVLGMPEREVQDLHDTSVLAIHGALLRQVA